METANFILFSETCHISNNPKISYKMLQSGKSHLSGSDRFATKKIPQGLEGSKAYLSEKSQKSGEVGDNIGKWRHRAS